MRSIAAAVFVVAASSAAHADVISVPATGNMWLAGMPDGSTAYMQDVAPQESPVLALSNMTSGMMLTFSASGLCSNTGSDPFFGPDGDLNNFFPHTVGAENGMSDVLAPLCALMGVFLDAGQPDSTAAPSGLDFSSAGLGTDFSSLAPQLKQVFFIGDGQSSPRALQTFVAPTGATRLFLGIMDAHNNLNNAGSFDVIVSLVPAPGAAALGVLASIIAFRRRSR